jgi:hypothetical protein
MKTFFTIREQKRNKFSCRYLIAGDQPRQRLLRQCSKGRGANALAGVLANVVDTGVHERSLPVGFRDTAWNRRLTVSA